MAFPLSVVQEAWKRAGGRCECRRTSHNHPYNHCGKQLSWDNRGKDGAWGCWEAHHISAGGPDTVSNCEILCCDCHKRTSTYG
jgi:hypothetical protein